MSWNFRRARNFAAGGSMRMVRGARRGATAKVRIPVIGLRVGVGGAVLLAAAAGAAFLMFSEGGRKWVNGYLVRWDVQAKAKAAAKKAADDAAGGK